MHNKVDKQEIHSFAQSFREQLANAQEAVRLAVKAEEERNAELTLAGLSDPKKKVANSTKAQELDKKLNNNSTKSGKKEDAPANSTKAATNSTKASNDTKKPDDKTPANSTKAAT